MTDDRPTTTQVYRVYIKATPEAIWDAITKPEWTERYGYSGASSTTCAPAAPTVRPPRSDGEREAEGVPSRRRSSTARCSRPTRRAGWSRRGGC